MPARAEGGRSAPNIVERVRGRSSRASVGGLPRELNAQLEGPGLVYLQALDAAGAEGLRSRQGCVRGCTSSHIHSPSSTPPPTHTHVHTRAHVHISSSIRLVLDFALTYVYIDTQPEAGQVNQLTLAMKREW